VRNWLFLLVALPAVAGCRTVIEPFVMMKPDYRDLPVDRLREVALEIERAVEAGNRTPDIPDRGGIVINTEDVLQSIRTRAARAELVNRFRDTGHAYEHQGLLWILRSAEYKKSGTRRKRDLDARLVIWENEDRRRIYGGILEAGNFPRQSRTAIQEVFHEARVACLRPGQKYMNASGEIVCK